MSWSFSYCSLKNPGVTTGTSSGRIASRRSTAVHGIGSKGLPAGLHKASCGSHRGSQGIFA